MYFVFCGIFFLTPIFHISKQSSEASVPSLVDVTFWIEYFICNTVRNKTTCLFCRHQLRLQTSHLSTSAKLSISVRQLSLEHWHMLLTTTDNRRYQVTLKIFIQYRWFSQLNRNRKQSITTTPTADSILWISQKMILSNEEKRLHYYSWSEWDKYLYTQQT